MMLRSPVVVLVALGLSTAAFAQDDDLDLAPLAPLAPLGKIKPKGKPKPKPKPKPAPAKPKPVAADDDLLAPIAPLASKGELTVKVAGGLTGATLSVDGKDVGVLPLPAQNIPPGEHTISVKKPGYAAFVKKVLVSGNKPVEVEAKLTAVAAVLTVTSDVPGAQVLLNGRSIGVVPLNEVEVPAGPAEVAVIKEGYREATQKITFVVGKEYPVSVKMVLTPPTTLVASDRPVDPRLTPGLRENPVTGVSVGPAEPITSKWYFWAGVAAVVVAGVAIGTAVGVSENEKNILTPNKICGPSGCDACIGKLSCGAGAVPMGSF